VFTRVAGLDVHKDVVVACVRTPLPDGNQAVQTASFGATTEDLLGLRDWLVGERVEVVGMESTGVYWKPVFYLLEDDVECWLLNARHLRNVPGRKTDLLTELPSSACGRCMRCRARLATVPACDLHGRHAA
jgi:transposase